MDIYYSGGSCTDATSMDAHDRPLKLHFIPFLAAGHMTPLCEMARSFAAHGQHVTIITTPTNTLSLQNSIHIDRASGHQINIHTLRFPSKQAGLPDGVENLTTVTDSETTAKVCRAAIFLLQENFEDFVVQNPPDCLVADFMYPWADDLASRLGIPRLAFNGFPIFTVCAMESIQRNPTLPGQDPDPFTIPGLPLPITMNIRPPRGFVRAMEKRLEVQAKSYGLLVNNFAGLDGEFVEHYEKTTGHRAWHIGPTALIHRTKEKAEGTQKNGSCLSWLNSKKPNSVLYICFGSLGHFSDEQLHELACALESSGHNFVWVVFRKDEAESEEEKEKWLPKGFEERMREQDKGLILRAWAPQVQILSHAAVGGFMTHCGWNSVVESVAAGVPMVTWPWHSDQFYTENLVTQVHGVGVEVGTEEWCLWVFDEKRKIVKKESIEKAVRRLMDEGGEGHEMRRRARELGEKAREAMKEGGTSHQNLETLIRELQGFRDPKLLNAT